MVIGGRVDYTPSVSVILYDAQTDAWEDGVSLPSAPLYGCCAVEHESAVIVVGRGPLLRFEAGRWHAEPLAQPWAEAMGVGSVLLG